MLNPWVDGVETARLPSSPHGISEPERGGKRRRGANVTKADRRRIEASIPRILVTPRRATQEEDNMNRVAVAALAVVLMISGCSGNDNKSDDTGLANPASVYCQEQGGTVDIRTDESGGQVGYCVFSDGTEVEEWAYYRGEAQPALP
jgi:uncharacterized protein